MDDIIEMDRRKLNKNIKDSCHYAKSFTSNCKLSSANQELQCEKIKNIIRMCKGLDPVIIHRQVDTSSQLSGQYDTQKSQDMLSSDVPSVFQHYSHQSTFLAPHALPKGHNDQSGFLPPTNEIFKKGSVEHI